MEKKSYGKCEDCKIATAVIKYSDEPVSALTHGMSIEYICRPCYIKRIEQAIIDLKKNLEIQKALNEGKN